MMDLVTTATAMMATVVLPPWKAPEVQEDLVAPHPGREDGRRDESLSPRTRCRVAAMPVRICTVEDWMTLLPRRKRVAFCYGSAPGKNRRENIHAMFGRLGKDTS